MIMNDPHCSLNVDEMEVSGGHRNKIPVLSPNDSNYGGGWVTKQMGNDKQLTAVIVTSAAGKNLPPIFILLEGTQWCGGLRNSILS